MASKTIVRTIILDVQQPFFVQFVIYNSIAATFFRFVVYYIFGMYIANCTVAEHCPHGQKSGKGITMEQAVRRHNDRTHLSKGMIIALILLLLLQTGYYIFLGAQKQVFNVDEFYTFLGANARVMTDGTLPYNTPLTTEQVNQFYSIQPNGRFDFAGVIDRIAPDCHPPLYYLVIHLLCSLFAPTFQFATYKWLAIGLNILLLIPCTLLVFGILRRLCANPTVCLVGTLLFALAPVTASTAIFCRMYALLLFFGVLFAWVHISYWDKPLDLHFFVIALLAAVGGTMSQYYFLIFQFFLCLWFGVRLLLQKRWKAAVPYLFTMLGSVGLCTLIFPPMLNQLLNSSRGQEAAKNLTKKPFLDQLMGSNGTFSLLDENVFGGLLKLLLVLFVLIGALLILGRIFTAAQRKGLWNRPEWMLLFTGAAYFLLVTKLAPYHSIRYWIIACGILLIATVSCLSKLVSFFVKRRYMQPIRILLCTALLFMTATNVAPGNLEFSQRRDPTLPNALVENNVQTIYFYTNDFWRTMPDYPAYQTAGQVIFLSPKTTTDWSTVDWAHSSLFIDVHVENAPEILDGIRAQGNTIEATKLGTNYADVYFVTAAQ